MRLDLTDDQLTLRDHMRNFFARECDPDVVRAAEPLGFDADLWDKAAAVGLPGMCLPETLGGAATDLTDTAIVMEELGRAAAPIPVVEHLVATRLLARTAEPDDDRFSRLASGDDRATLALRPAIDGVWRLVPAGAVSDLVVGVDRGRLVASAATPPMSSPRNHACAPLADRRVSGSDSFTLVASDDDSEAAFAAAIDEWKTLIAAALVGVAARALEIGVAYATTRHQFNRPIGSFQAVQHGLADVVGPIDGARMLTGRAAWSCDHDPADRGRLASMAFLFAAETARTATARALHYHGGYGVMKEYDIQLFYRRARGWPLQLQSLDQEELDLGNRLFAGAAT